MAPRSPRRKFRCSSILVSSSLAVFPKEGSCDVCPSVAGGECCVQVLELGNVPQDRSVGCSFRDAALACALLSACARKLFVRGVGVQFACQVSVACSRVL